MSLEIKEAGNVTEVDTPYGQIIIDLSVDNEIEIRIWSYGDNSELLGILNVGCDWGDIQ
jgi:hypothetical protein